MEIANSTEGAAILPSPPLAGVHHSARPTWKLKETVEFYRDMMGLKLCHAISARGWGADDHPDFLHFFFDAGNHGTIAFFYYLKTERPAESLAANDWLYRSVHTAWRVETQADLLAWRERFERQGFDVMQVGHEIIESIYVTDPNGYMVEISWQTRPMGDLDGRDAQMTVEAALAVEARTGKALETIDDLWREKGDLLRTSLEVAA